MTKQLLLPKFLSPEIGILAIDKAYTNVFEGRVTRDLVKRKSCHIVILVPEMNVISRTWPNYEIEPYCIAQMSFGDKMQWPHKFDEIAQCKALQLWHDRNNCDSDVIPHLLFPGDTPFWGGVKRDGIVVACSGVQPHFDRLVAGIAADICIALAYNAKVEWIKKNPNADFLD